MGKRDLRERVIEKHHVIPRSRGGTLDDQNIAYVPRFEHRVYHLLFENRTPDEILDYLSKHFWNGYIPK